MLPVHPPGYANRLSFTFNIVYIATLHMMFLIQTASGTCKLTGLLKILSSHLRIHNVGSPAGCHQTLFPGTHMSE